MTNKKVFISILLVFIAALGGAVFVYVMAWEYDGYFRTIAFNRNGDNIITLENGVELLLWDVNTGQEIRSMKKPYYRGGADYVSFSPDGRRAVTGGTDGIILWDIETGMMMHLFENSCPTDSRISGPCVDFSPDGRYILSGESEDSLILWNAENYTKARIFIDDNTVTETASETNVLCIKFSPDGRFAISAGDRLILWNVETGKISRIFHGHKKTVISAAISNDNRFVMSGSWDQSLKLWSMASGEEIRSLRVDHFPRTIAFSPDGRYALTGDPYGALKLWDMRKGIFLFFMQSTKGKGVLSIVVSPDNRRVAAGLNGRLKLWDINSGNEILTFRRKTTFRLIFQSIIWKYIKI